MVDSSEGQARYAAKKLGWALRKSGEQFQIFDAKSGAIIADNLTADDVINFCNDAAEAAR
jgi:hypothetical protein